MLFSQTNNLVVPYNPVFQAALEITFLQVFKYFTLSVLGRSYLTSCIGKLIVPFMLKKTIGSYSSCCSSVVVNSTSIPEDAGLIPGLPQWVSCGVGRRCGSDPPLLMAAV